MQILKADNCKSITVSHLLNSCPNSLCIVYHDYYPLIYESIWLNSEEYSLDDLKQCVVEEIINAIQRSGYLIIYTNKTEQELTEFISFIEKQSIYPFDEVLITCKP